MGSLDSTLLGRVAGAQFLVADLPFRWQRSQPMSSIATDHGLKLRAGTAFLALSIVQGQDPFGDNLQYRWRNRFFYSGVFIFPPALCRLEEMVETRHESNHK